jgi:hypothetical protein
MTFRTVLETITPAKAQKWLDEREANRPLAIGTAKKYAAAMAAGEWDVNGETIKFNSHNRMFDGQHRCQGIVIAQKSIQSLVVRGLGQETFPTIDGGKVRGTDAIFAMNGEKNTNQLAAAVKWVYRYNNGKVGSGRTVNPRIKQSIDLLDSNPGLRESVAFVGHYNKLMPPSMAAAMYYIASRKYPTQADSFFRSLADGQGLMSDGKTSAIYRLRHILMSNLGSDRKMKDTLIWALTSKAFRYYCEGKTVKSLRFNADSEEFPSLAW